MTGESVYTAAFRPLSHRGEFCGVRRQRPQLPLRGLAFERRQWRKQRERQAAAVRKCESE